MALNINGTTGISGVDGAASAPAVTGTDSNTGINFGSDILGFNTGGVERSRFDANGNLLIGTTSFNNGNFTGSGHGITVGGAAPQITLHQTVNDTDVFFGNNGTNAYLHTANSMNMVFGTNDTERMRIITSGFLKAKGNSASYQNVGGDYHEIVGDTANDVVAKLQHKSSTGYGLQMQLNHGNGSLYAFNLRNFASGSDNCFIRGDGDLENINNSYGGTSDIKLKENIVDAKSQWNDIKSLKVRNFNYKADENKTKFIGLVAQEAETVCPSLVKSQPDLGENNEDLGTETKVLKYSILYMKAIKALQEAQARIETLETKVAA